MKALAAFAGGPDLVPSTFLECRHHIYATLVPGDPVPVPGLLG